MLVFYRAHYYVTLVQQGLRHAKILIRANRNRCLFPT